MSAVATYIGEATGLRPVDEQAFGEAVRRRHALVRDVGMNDLMAAKDLQARWRQVQGLTTGDNGIADGTMLRVVRQSLGRDPR